MKSLEYVKIVGKLSARDAGTRLCTFCIKLKIELSGLGKHASLFWICSSRFN